MHSEMVARYTALFNIDQYMLKHIARQLQKLEHVMHDVGIIV